MFSKELEPFCFWCGGNARLEFACEPRPFYPDKNTMCNNCVQAVRGGIILFELTETNPGCGNPAMIEGRVYYTGRWTILTDIEASQVFTLDKLTGVFTTRIAGLREDNYAKAGFNKYPYRSVH